MSSNGIVVVGISGASGVSVGIRVLELLEPIEKYEVHLVITPAGIVTIGLETDRSLEQVEALADVVHKNSHIGASIASGSTMVSAMIVAPCSIRTLSAIASGVTDDLLTRAADVCLKEGSRLVLQVRESPIHRGHLASMSKAAESGAVIALPVPAFYNRPSTVDEIIDDLARGLISRAGISNSSRKAWKGVPPDQHRKRSIQTDGRMDPHSAPRSLGNPPMITPVRQGGDDS